MANVYFSFLGKGSFQPQTKTWDYKPAVYELGGRRSSVTKFVQVAELELIGPASFDRVLIAVTETSRKIHLDALKAQLPAPVSERVKDVLFTEDMSTEGQWSWFERILAHITPGDTLTLDLTHGYRSMPIVFSAAVHFLQRARGIRLAGVYYGVFDPDAGGNPAQIVDMKDFYLINEVAEGVSRLTEDADAGRLAQVIRSQGALPIKALGDPRLVGDLEDLTNRIRNVDMHNIAAKAGEVVSTIDRGLGKAGPVEDLLLELLRKKFCPLVPRGQWTGRYDGAYFEAQVALVEMLLEHRLSMQAFTVLREVVGSIGLIPNPKANTRNSEGIKQRRKADVFVNMCQFLEARWDFPKKDMCIKEGLLPWYRELEAWGVIAMLQGMLTTLLEYRNGFDHGWSRVRQSQEDAQEKGKGLLAGLREALARIEAHLASGASASSNPF